MNFFSNLKTNIIMIVVIVSLAVAAFFYIKSLRSSIETLEAEKLSYTQAITNLQNSLTQVRTEIANQKKLHEDFVNSVNDIRKEADDEAERLGNTEWEKEANTDREALERSINEQMKKVFDDMKEASK